MKKIRNIIIIISVMVLALAACVVVEPPSDVVVNAVVVSPSSRNIEVGGTVQLGVTVHGQGNPNNTVIWTSNNEPVATVDASGLVRGVAQGTATITARSTVDTTVAGTMAITVGTATQGGNNNGTTPGYPPDASRDGWVAAQRELLPPGSELRISFFHGGWDDRWIRDMARAFEDFHEGNVTVTLEPSFSSAHFTTLLEGTLSTGTPSDIFISHNIPWQMLGGARDAPPLIAPLNSLYDAVIYYDYNNLLPNGTPTPITFRDRVAVPSLDSVRHSGDYWRVPFTQGGGGIAYNATMFQYHGWDIPETFDELMALSQKIYDANIPVVGGAPGQTVAPFVWSGWSEYVWDSVIFDWWVQMAGIEAYNQFMRFETVDQFNPEVHPYLRDAWSYWHSLIVDNPHFSVPMSPGMFHTEKNISLATGHAAMAPATSWMGNAFGIIAEDFFGDDVGIMPTPFVDGARTDEQGNPIRVVYDITEDSIVVAQRGANTDVAMEFLKWMAVEENALIFPRETNGGLLAMNYDLDRLLAGQLGLEIGTPYGQIPQSTWTIDMLGILYESVRFCGHSPSPMSIFAGIEPMPLGRRYTEAFVHGLTPTNHFDQSWHFASSN